MSRKPNPVPFPDHADPEKATERKTKAARRQQVDDDESFANRAVQAQIDHAMGVDNPDYDWLVEPYE